MRHDTVMKLNLLIKREIDDVCARGQAKVNWFSNINISDTNVNKQQFTITFIWIFAN